MNAKGNLEKTVAEVPNEIVTEVKTTPEAINPREELEARVIAKNEEVTPIEVLEETEATVESEKEETTAAPKSEESTDPIERIKRETQKRINKLTARTKSAEEELAELRAENERLRKQESKPEPKSEPVEKREPTMEECRKALAKAFADGDHEFAAQITEYMAEAKAKAQRIEAEKAYAERTTKQTEAQKKQLADWTALCRDYEPVDAEGKVDLKHPLNLSNQNGLLYKTALGLFQDKDLKEKYAGYDPITGFRLAVNDAYRGIIENGLYKPVRETVKVVGETKMRQFSLAESDSEGDDGSSSQQSNTLSDADKVREEIANRQRNRFKRPVPR